MNLTPEFVDVQSMVNRLSVEFAFTKMGTLSESPHFPQAQPVVPVDITEAIQVLLPSSIEIQGKWGTTLLKFIYIDIRKSSNLFKNIDKRLCFARYFVTSKSLN